jgi:hypothetical protein
MFEWLGLLFQGVLILGGLAIAIAIIVSLSNRSRGGGAGTNLNDLLDIQARLLDAREELEKLRRLEPSKVRMLTSDRANFDRDLAFWGARVSLLTNEISRKERRLEQLDLELPPEDVSAEPRVVLREWRQRKVI